MAALSAPALPAAATAAPAKTPQQLTIELQKLKQQQSVFERKLSDLSQETSEHSLVVKTLSSVKPSRKCWRLIGGVLVEKTAGEVLPEIQTNHNNLEKVTESIKARMSSIQKEVS